METKSTDICGAGPKWHYPIGEKGKPLVTLCCSFTTENQYEGPVPRPSLSMGDFSGLLRRLKYFTKNLIKPLIVPES